MESEIKAIESFGDILKFFIIEFPKHVLNWTFLLSFQQCKPKCMKTFKNADVKGLQHDVSIYLDI
jgi:hypothetical protein